MAKAYAEKYEPRFKKVAEQAYAEGLDEAVTAPARMKVTLYCGSCADQIDQLLNERVIELQRIPNTGETITLAVGDYWVEAKVGKVYTSYVAHGNEHWKTFVWGDRYAMYLEDIETIETYGKHN